MTLPEARQSECVTRLGAARVAARKLRSATAAARNHALVALALLIERKSALILKANAEDLAALPSDTAAAFRDRLTLNEKRLKDIVLSLQAVVALPSPVGEVVETQVLANGLKVRRERAPLGVILMIFESRPNVAVEAFSLALKSGNVILLRGGKESMRSTAAFYALMSQALVEAGLPEESFWGITDPDRELARFLLTQSKLIDVVVPRGGDRLIEFVVEHSRIPIIKNDRGLCHVYVHEDADQEQALAIIQNAKCQRPGVCNSMETVLVHRAVAAQFLPRLYAQLKPAGVKWHCDPESLAILKGQAGGHGAGVGASSELQAATSASFDTEYLAQEMNCAVVGGLDEALAHIERHGSRHSEVILTRSPLVASRFISEVDAAAAYSNASSRFTDGFELGLGGELGISTQKLHVRGPVGLRELTSTRWIIEGDGQIRG